MLLHAKEGLERDIVWVPPKRWLAEPPHLFAVALGVSVCQASDGLKCSQAADADRAHPDGQHCRTLRAAPHKPPMRAPRTGVSAGAFSTDYLAFVSAASMHGEQLTSVNNEAELQSLDLGL